MSKLALCATLLLCLARIVGLSRRGCNQTSGALVALSKPRNAVVLSSGVEDGTTSMPCVHGGACVLPCCLVQPHRCLGYLDFLVHLVSLHASSAQELCRTVLAPQAPPLAP